MSNEVMAAYFPITNPGRFAEDQIVDLLQAIRTALRSYCKHRPAGGDEVAGHGVFLPAAKLLLEPLSELCLRRTGLARVSQWGKAASMKA